MTRRKLSLILLPVLVSSSIWSGLGDVGKWIDKMTTMCLVIVILIVVLFILYILSKLFGGGSRG